MGIFKSGSTVTLSDSGDYSEKLQKGFYQIVYNPKIGFILEQKPDFELPAKIYGDMSIVDRWLKSVENNTSKNLGILLSGAKGSGKTITAQVFCVKAKRPVLILNDAFDGHENDLMGFLSRKELQGSIVLVDEFDKNFPREDDQKPLISLMDGVYDTSLIFLLTMNRGYVNDYLINRPNRIKYHKPYLTLSDDLINDIIDDLLVNKEFKQSIFDYVTRIDFCTTDILISLIKEINLFNQDAATCASHMLLREERKYYSCKLIHNNTFIDFEDVDVCFSEEDEYIEFMIDKRNFDNESIIKLQEQYPEFNLTYSEKSLNYFKISKNKQDIFLERDNLKFVLKKKYQSAF